MPSRAVAADEAGLPACERVAESVLFVALDEVARRVGLRQDAADLVVVEPAVGAGVGRRVGLRDVEDVANLSARSRTAKAGDAGAHHVVLDGHGVRKTNVVEIEVLGVGVGRHAADAKQSLSRIRRGGVGRKPAFPDNFEAKTRRLRQIEASPPRVGRRRIAIRRDQRARRRFEMV